MEGTDGNGSCVRVFLFDYQKAFDLVDHKTMVCKLKSLSFPTGTPNWIVDFLRARQQRVKLSNDCYSEWRKVPVGVPQGTKPGPWLFILMLSDLRLTGVDHAKFADDLTISEVVLTQAVSSTQTTASSVQTWSDLNMFRLHDEKCKELNRL